MRIGLDGSGPQSWRFLAALGLCFLFWGCVTAPRVKVVAEVVNPVEAKSRSVAVVADSFMDDAEEADKLAKLVRDQLASKGFEIKKTENEADLVVIATIERFDPATAAATTSPRMRRPFDSPYGLGQSSLMESQNALRNLGFESSSLPVQEEPKVGLMVTAVSREVWSKALGEDQTEIPRVWRITAISPSKKQDVTPKLVEAIGSKLGELDAAPASKKPSPPPAAPPKKPKKR